ncbi:peptidoglycan-binding protein [Spongiactinospora sp. TRM90649]|uniref:peptidoglycan-binding protein n=1 Tax=Spongiactinospora sp. TRM90649 TaxID=3031114 RepID=UPI0023F8B52C|nr:peptidoglycan-binding protein [Spongiactinospora sp. TRM90649]MDF5756197.1 peptidoglycan-binding protein [Spongiactinospora sp. TRM90649]
MRRRWAVIAGVAAAAVGATVAAVALPASAPTSPAASASVAPPSVATAEVVRTDLVDRSDVDGTLGHARPSVIVGHGGTLTWLPRTGAVIRRGQRVHGVDGHAVPLLYGSVPLWRALGVGSRGRDVLLLERNLAALGHHLTVDEHYTWTTARAVRSWQRELRMPRTGVVNPGDAVVAPGPLRITAVRGTLGAPARGTVLTGTGTERRVTVRLPVTRQALAKVRAKVRIELPGGRATTGRVTRIGTLATAAPSEDPGAGEGTRTATVPVEIALDRPSAAGRLDGAPVTVGFAGATRKGVLAVPVNALTAGDTGGYAVEAVPGGPIPVRLGLFADGKVEVSGPGLAAGMRVEVPSP